MIVTQKRDKLYTTVSLAASGLTKGTKIALFGTIKLQSGIEELGDTNLAVANKTPDNKVFYASFLNCFIAPAAFTKTKIDALLKAKARVEIAINGKTVVDDFLRKIPLVAPPVYNVGTVDSDNAGAEVFYGTPGNIENSLNRYSVKVPELIKDQSGNVVSVQERLLKIPGGSEITGNIILHEAIADSVFAPDELTLSFEGYSEELQ